MPQVINTNIASLTAQRNLNTSQSANQTALNRLSSGLRINSAKDDAAGLAISTRFTSQVKGLNVAIRNAGDGVSLAQTAEGAIGSMSDNLQRIRELALQSANATNSDLDRVALQAEVDQLISEVTRTAEKTNFNGSNLLDGNFKASFQIGANAGETVAFNIQELTAETLGGAANAGVSAIGNANALANGDLTINGINIAPSVAADDSSSSGSKASSAIAKVATINKLTDEHGVVAQVLTNKAAGTTQVAAATDGAINLNGVQISLAVGGVNTDADRQSVVTAINSKSDSTGVTAIDSGSTAKGVILQAKDGRNIVLSYNVGGVGNANLTAASTGLASAGTFTGGYVLRSEVRGEDITITGGDNSGQGNIVNSGLVAGVYADGTAAVTNTAQTARLAESLGAGLIGTSAPAEPATFSAGTAAVAASVNGGSASTTDDFSANNATFDVIFSDGQTASNITVDVNVAVANQQALVADINAGLAAVNMNDGNAASTRIRAFVDSGGNVDFEAVGEFGRNGGQFTLNDYTGADAGALTAITTILGAGNEGVATTNGQQGFIGNFRDSTTFTGANFSGNGDTGTFDINLGTAAEITADTALTATITIDSNNTGNNGVATLVADLTAAITASTLNGMVQVYNAGAGVGFRTIGDSAADDLDINIDNLVGNGNRTATDVQNALGLGGTTQAVNTGFNAGYLGAYVEANSFGGNFNYSANNASFDVTIGTTTTTVTVNTDATNGTNDVYELASELNVAFTAASINGQIRAINNDIGNIKLELIGTAADGTTNFSIGNVQEANGGTGGAAALNAAFAGIVQGQTTTNADSSSVRNNRVAFRLDGASTDSTISLTAGVYTTAEDVVNEINARFSAGSVNARATLENDLIGIRSTNTGATGAIAQLKGSALTNIGMTSTTAATAGTVGGGTVLSEGDLSINDVTISASQANDDTASDTTAQSSNGAASGIAIAAAINKSTASTAVTATVNATTVVGGTGSTTTARSGDTGYVIINGITTAGITTSADNEADRTTAINAINTIAGQTGVTATDNGSSITLTAKDGRNISVAIDTNDVANEARSTGYTAADFTVGIGLDYRIEGIGAADITGVGANTYANQAETTYSTVTLTSADEVKVESGSNGGTAISNLGFSQGTFGGGTDGQFLKDVDITTVDGAVEAIAAIDNALNSLSSERAKLGAIQNRFESTISNLSITSENLASANSRIQDADFAAETAELARTQVLQQAGISILAQANAAPQQILALLQ